MEHFAQLDEMVNKLVVFCSKLKNDAKYAAVIYSIVKLLLANYPVVEALGMIDLVRDQIKDESKENIEALLPPLYI